MTIQDDCIDLIYRNRECDLAKDLIIAPTTHANIARFINGSPNSSFSNVVIKCKKYIKNKRSR